MTIIESAATVEPDGLRKALSRFATGIAVVTAKPSDAPAIGITVSSFNSVSLDPPLVLWSLARTSPSLASLRRAPGFVVNVLLHAQQHLAHRFSSPVPDRFADVDCIPGRECGPILAGSLAHFECMHHAEYDGGDHVIFIGRVTAFSAKNGEPLVYCLGRLGTVAA
jgi:flavin reductase (DIM6/NTAB) family NADH-FMN oxidoreductase RutF